MRSYKISNKGTTSLFNNRFLEALTRTNFLFPVIMYMVLSVALSAFALLSGNRFIDLLFYFPVGLLIFSLVEYLIHRFLFHFEAKSEKMEELKYKIHGVHHAFPRDKDRLAMPPVISVCLALLFYGIFRLLLAEKVFLFFPGFLAGYSIYLIIHYSVHRFRPPKNFLRILWSHHALHHYKSEDTAFAVSMPLWDYIFRTLPEKSPQA
jgi:sterol desaturase/sphingolipid hydroxylase (fatty acid hydroxylase superfamily)